MKSEKINVGSVFTRWTVVAKVESRKTPCGTKKAYWLCQCDCGERVEVRAEHLNSGRTQSCGCLHKEIAAGMKLTHGESRTPLHMVWCSIIQRCENPKNKWFKNYGGRGISVFPGWHDYATFLRDMGPKYQSGLTIDRENNDGNYEPGNCRWVTNKVNCRNQRQTIRVEWDGQLVSLNELAELHGIKKMTAYNRFRLKGWTVRQSLGIDAPPKIHRKPITDATKLLMSAARVKHWANRRAAA